MKKLIKNGLLLMFINKVFNWFKTLNKNNSVPQCCLNFPNTITREEYYHRKTKREKLAISKTLFWQELNVDIFSNNIVLNNDNICPYCGNTLPIRKGKSFKCPCCKNRIFRKREILSKREGLFTEQERDLLNKLWEEVQTRQKFLELWDETNNLLEIKLDKNRQYTMQTAIQQAVINLHLGKLNLYTKNNLKELRRYHLLEAKLQAFCGAIAQATNAYMTILYIDLMGDYCTLYDTPEELDKETKEEFPEWSQGFIAPAIYNWAFAEKLPLDKNKKLFLYNANILKETLKFEPPISPIEAWDKILEYTKNLN